MMMATWLKPDSEKTLGRMKEYICREVPTEDGGYLEIETELIRCKDCRHMRTDRGNVFCETLEDMFYHYEYEQPINEDFFCAWAEPKETNR